MSARAARVTVPVLLPLRFFLSGIAGRKIVSTGSAIAATIATRYCHWTRRRCDEDLR